MARYLIINLIVLTCCLGVCLRWLKRPSRAWWVMLGVLLLLTAVFDTAIIAAHVVGYDPEKILGVYIGKAPIEDFFYALVAALIVPVIWRRLEGENSV